MKTVYIDLDGTLADFDAGVGRKEFDWNPPEMFVPGFFLGLPVIEGAKEAISTLFEFEDKGWIKLYIASKHTTRAPNSASEKILWVEKHFPKLLKRMILICDKTLLDGHFLIDDDYQRWKGFKGTIIPFNNTKPKESWNGVVAFILDFLRYEEMMNAAMDY